MSLSSQSETSTKRNSHLEPSEKTAGMAPHTTNCAVVAKDEEFAAVDLETTAPAAIHSEPPNGGFYPWLQVLASSFLFFNTWGLVNAFGVYQTYYDSALDRSPSDISWIGTFQGFLLLFVGAVAGPLYDKGHLRFLLAAGSFLVVFGLMMTSISTKYYQVFLAQGVAIGLGAGFLMIPGLAIVAQYFSTKRALAIGFTAAGGSIGALIYPVVFRQILAQASFGWATRAIGFIALGTLLFSNFVLRSRVPPNKVARALIDMSAFKSAQFVTFTAALFFYFAGIYFPFFYVSSWAQDVLGVNEDLSFYLFCVLNAGSIFGRILPGLMADKFGSLNLVIPTILLTGMLSFAWIGVHSFGELVVFCIFYGFFSGASVSLPGTIVALLTPEISKTGTWMGMCFSMGALGLLIGNPIAGAILDASGGSYVGAQCFSGAMVLVGFVFLCIVRYLQFRQGVTWRTKT